MKIAFFSEIGSNIGTDFPRTFENMRTDVSWAVSLKAPVLSLESALKYNSKFQPRSSDGTTFDLGIIIVPKKNPERAFKCFEKERSQCHKWASMQESNNSYWQNGSISEQIDYITFLSNCDIIFCHNERDKLYYEGLLPGKRVEVLPSLMIEDAMPNQITQPEHRSGCMIGGNWTEWYSGQDSFFIAQEFGEQIYAPSMGRKQEEEDRLEDIKYLPYMNWQQWISELSKRRYAVHLMRTYAAGTFSLNCAKLGIPCIGWDYMDTQKKCFPELSFKEGDMVAARKAAKHLKENKVFYNYCSAYAKKAYEDNFSEKVFLERFNSNFKNN